MWDLKKVFQQNWCHCRDRLWIFFWALSSMPASGLAHLTSQHLARSEAITYDKWPLPSPLLHALCLIFGIRPSRLLGFQSTLSVEGSPTLSIWLHLIKVTPDLPSPHLLSQVQWREVHATCELSRTACLSEIDFFEHTLDMSSHHLDPCLLLRS